MTKQRKHLRKSKKGKRFKAGRRRGPITKGMSKEQKETVQEFLDKISGELKMGRPITIKDFGSFRVRKVPAKKGGKKVFMPMLGKEIVTKAKPASTKIRFIASKKLRRK